jgi:methylmalonyl-CoA/ethylmalonyl-CoA epimerase
VKLDHIAVAVKNLDSTARTWRDLLGIPGGEIESVPEQGVRLIRLEPGAGPCVELIAPLGSESPVARFLSKRGEGLHHLCFEVENLEEAVGRLRKAGFRFVQDTPGPGAEGSRVIFLHPSGTNGVLIELKAGRPGS